MNKNSSNIIKEVLLAFAMGIIFSCVNRIKLHNISKSNDWRRKYRRIIINRFSNANCIYNLLCKKDIKQN